MKLSKVKLLLIILSTILVLFVVFACLFVGYGYKYKKLAIKYSKQYGIDENVVLAIIQTESGFNNSETSSKGAIGLMQIMPETAEYISVMKGGVRYNLNDPETNIDFGVYYYKYLLEKFKSEDVAICAYNAGESTVLKWFNGGFDVKNIKYKETLNYYKRVKFYKRVYRLWRTI